MKNSFEIDERVYEHIDLQKATQEEKAGLADMLDTCCDSITLNANDTFGYACADSVQVDWQDLWMLKEVYDLYGYYGLIAFMSVIRKQDVLPALMTPQYWVARDYMLHFVPFES